MMMNIVHLLLQTLSAVHRQLVNAARTVSVWLVGIILYYYVDPSYGEALNMWSIMEVCVRERTNERACP